MCTDWGMTTLVEEMASGEKEVPGIVEEGFSELKAKCRERSLELENFFFPKITKKFLYKFIFSYTLP